MKQKRMIRANIIRARDALNETTRTHKSTIICEKLIELADKELPRVLPSSNKKAKNISEKNISNSPIVAVYRSMRGEVSLERFIEAAYFRDWSICFPCMVHGDLAKSSEEYGPSTVKKDKMVVSESQSNRHISRMDFYFVPQDRYEQARTTFLSNPTKCVPCSNLAQARFVPVHPANIDMVVVPLVAFDACYNRLGYGGGNYDRLLLQLSPHTLVVGVAFNEQRVEAIPLEPHDQALPLIISA